MRYYQLVKRNFSLYFPRIYKLADRYKKLIKFGIVGVAATAVNLASLFIFTDILGIWYMISAVLAFIFAFVVSFSFQKFWTFRDNSTHKIAGQMLFYFIITFGSLSLNLVGLYIFVDIIGVHYLISQIIIALGLALLRFLINNFLIFNQDNENKSKQGSTAG